MKTFALKTVDPGGAAREEIEVIINLDHFIELYPTGKMHTRSAPELMPIHEYAVLRLKNNSEYALFRDEYYRLKRTLDFFDAAKEAWEIRGLQWQKDNTPTFNNGQQLFVKHGKTGELIPIEIVETTFAETDAGAYEWAYRRKDGGWVFDKDICVLKE